MVHPAPHAPIAEMELAMADLVVTEPAPAPLGGLEPIAQPVPVVILAQIAKLARFARPIQFVMMVYRVMAAVFAILDLQGPIVTSAWVDILDQIVPNVLIVVLTAPAMMDIMVTERAPAILGGLEPPVPSVQLDLALQKAVIPAWVVIMAQIAPNVNVKPIRPAMMVYRVMAAAFAIIHLLAQTVISA